ncbi:hypothetical protein [Nocardioides speluncae]|uniref:hypothetical protein n=1 Tax=Nocardioides speluncae TaxID=2670337 RepID=UPI000D6863C7|nr:hypothetical protein [Nocardioides speluncae]
MKHALLAASLLLVAGTAVGCGGAPTDASKEDFCKQYTKIGEAQSADDANDWGKEMEDVGTPEGISDDARDGFEIIVDAAKDAEEKDGEIKEPDIDKDDEKKVAAFSKYVGEECAPDAG